MSTVNKRRVKVRCWEDSTHKLGGGGYGFSWLSKVTLIYIEIIE